MSDPPKGILPTTPPPPPPPDLHAALDKIDVRRVQSLLRSLTSWRELIDAADEEFIVKAVIDAIREQLPPPVTR